MGNLTFKKMPQQRAILILSSVVSVPQHLKGFLDPERYIQSSVN